MKKYCFVILALFLLASLSHADVCWEDEVYPGGPLRAVVPSSHLESVPSPPIILSQPFSKEGNDTIYYDDGNDASHWYGINYWGVRFVPEKPCTVKTALIHLTSTSSNSCQARIHPDVGGDPGSIAETKAFTATDGWNTIDFSSPHFYSDPFWLTFYVPTGSGGPYVSGDGAGGENSYYSSDGNSWTNMAGNNSDLLIRAVGDYVSYPHDVAVKSIIQPQEYIDVAQFSPQAIFMNYGTNTETFYVTCLIETTGVKFYTSTKTVENLAPREIDTVTFDPFDPDSGEVYWVTFISELPGDSFPKDDTLGTVARAYYTPRMILGELITSTTCGPCKAANDTLDDIYPDFSDWLSLIRYHGWWPSSSDPFYQANVAENTDRINYYGADYAPHLWIDGAVDGGSSRFSWREMFQEEAEKKSPLEMNLFGTYNESKGDGTISTTITVTGRPLFGNLRIRYAIVESDIYYVAPNGQRYFYQTFRDMFPTTTGVSLDIDWKETVADEQDFTISGSWVEDNCDIVVFVQSDETKDVLQAARISILDLLGLLLSVEEPEDTFQIVNLGDTAQFPFAVKNTKSFGDSIILDVPDSLVNLPVGWDFYLHTGAAKDTFPQTIYLGPGEERTDLEVHITTLAVDTGTGTLTLMAQSNWNPAVVRSLRFTAHSEVGVEEAETIRLPLALSISPNPGFGNTNINYQIDKSGFVNLEVYDVTGRLVTTLVNEHKESGSYSMSWNPSSAGIYFYRLKTRDKVLTRKIILVK